MQWVEDVKMGLIDALYLCQKCFHIDEAMQAREGRKKNGFVSMVSSGLVKSYASINTPVSNITRGATVENTGRVEELSKRSSLPQVMLY